MATNHAHRGVETRSDRTVDREFEAFCRRQFSRVAAVAQAAHRRYVNRVVRLAVDEQYEVVQRGYTFGGGRPDRTDEDGNYLPGYHGERERRVQRGL